LQTGALRTTDEILDAFAAVGATPILEGATR
ncbi:cysteine hydrolase, partial [Mycobacterium sp. ITM-2017-0098]